MGVLKIMATNAKARPTHCDQCNGEMKLARSTPHPDKGGLLHVFECQGCKMPMVVYEPPRD